MYTVWHNVCENNYSHIVVCTNNYSHIVVYIIVVVTALEGGRVIFS